MSSSRKRGSKKTIVIPDPIGNLYKYHNGFMKRYFAYVLASQKNGTIYVGVTGNLQERIYFHQKDLIKGFTQRYGVHDLVYYEEYRGSIDAIAREKQLKKWNRKWKIELIEKDNPEWSDLSETLN